MTASEDDAATDGHTPDAEKAEPQVQPDMPPREPEIEDPELRSGHIGTDATTPPGEQ